jgi:hypothetical protein
VKEVYHATRITVKSGRRRLLFFSVKIPLKTADFEEKIYRKEDRCAVN